MKDLFKPKPRTLNPADLVRETRSLLMSLDPDSDSCNRKKADKMVELGKHLLELKSTLYGRESEPIPDACSRLTQEFFQGDTLRLLIRFLPKLNLEARKDATQVVANLQRQQVNFRLIASDYLEANKDLVDLLMAGYEDMDIALHYGAMFRECIRHQNIARYVLDTEHIKKFFDYIQLPNYEIASDAFSTFNEIMTRHRSTVAGFLESNYEWFFAEFNSKLLESSNYITRRLCVKLLGDILQHRSSFAVMTRYVSSNGNLKISMNLLKESNTGIPVAAFDVFKLFVTNESKPHEIVCLLSANRNKLLKFFTNFKLEKDTDESILKQFEADKLAVVTEIEALQPLVNPD